ncbi:hypothetical protein GGI07_000116 [Coemansia sp. Benny D115]|nr:hypothetical protein GGI07_000116 [Coemansia sp. Benny D115]
MFGSQFSATSGSLGAGSLVAEKRRCPVCNTRTMKTRSDGRVSCKNGHEQVGVMQEVEDEYIGAVTRRQMPVIERVNKAKVARERRLRGHNARLLIIHVLQLSLKEQVTALVEDLGAPVQLLDEVRNLWLLYVTKLGRVELPEDNRVVDLLGKSMSATQGTSSQRATQSSSNFLDSQQYSQSDLVDDSQDSDMDIDIGFLNDSLDSLMRRIDDDVNRDEMEMDEWNEGNRRNGDSASGDESDSGGAKKKRGPSKSSRPARRRQASRPTKAPRSARSSSKNPGIADRHRALLQYIEENVHMECLPAIIYLAFVKLRLPITHADLYRLYIDEHVPYASTFQRIPAAMTAMMGKGIMNLFITNQPPTVRRMRIMTHTLMLFYEKHYRMEFLPIDMPLQMLWYVKRLGINVEFYLFATRILELTDIANIKISYKYFPEMFAMAAVVVALKLHYGFDEIERQNSPELGSDSVLEAPSLAEFLAKWRSDWEREMSISLVPELTACGERWQREFSAYCQRRMARTQLEGINPVYEVIARRYREVINDLASRSNLQSEQAQKMLPRQYYTTRSNDEEPWRATDRPEILSYVEPVRMPVLKPIEDSKEEESYETIVEPFDNHPEIKLGRGEHYIMVPRSNFHRLSGYMVPVLGLITARCAAMVGCSQGMLLDHIFYIEVRIQRLVKPA